MSDKQLPTPEELRKLLRYEPDTGLLYWRERTVSMFNEGTRSVEVMCRIWNANYSGNEAFVTYNENGDLTGGILRRKYKSHRVAYAIFHGVWPENYIDHINGVRDDNRIVNLRDVSRAENMKNAAVSSANTSGAIGVDWLKVNKKWRARIKVDGATINIGCYKTKKEAMSARKDAEKKYGFHVNHGRKA